MSRTFWRTATALLVIVALLLSSSPAWASNVTMPPTPQDGDAPFRAFDQELAGKLARLPADASSTGAIADTIGQVVPFWAWDFQTNSYYQTNASLVRQGANVLLYVESGLNVAPNVLDDIVAKFDTKIYPNVRAAFGSEPNPGIDGDARVTLLLLNIRDGLYHGGGNYVTGYFSGVNEYRQSDLDAWFPGMQKSNQREMLYLDAASPSELGSTGFYFGLAHEFQHMIHWNMDQDEEPWVNEGLSDLAGFVAGFGHPNNHINAFVNNPDEQLTAWNGTLADYGSAYMFFLYLWEKFGGNDITRAVVSSPQNGTAGIDAALAARGYSQRFADVFGTWTVANYLDDASLNNGLYAYSTLGLVDTGADGVTTFQRPKLTAAYTNYPAAGSNNGLRAWSAQYLKLSAGSGNLSVSFNGADTAALSVTVVKSSSAGFAPGSNSLANVPLNAAQDGSLSVTGFGSNVAAVLLVVTNRSAAVNPAGYNFSAAMDIAPTPTPTPTPSPTPPPTPTQTPVPASITATISLQAGWNLISLPVSPTTALTAEGLLQLINSQGGQATDVNRWQAGAWNTHLAGLPFNDFALEPGRGYFVKANRASTVTIAGHAYTGAPQVALAPGWNLVAFPYLRTTYTAESLIQAIASQGGKVAEIDRWSANGWSAHVSGLPFNNFTIDSTAAYFIRASQPSTWTP